MCVTARLGTLVVLTLTLAAPAAAQTSAGLVSELSRDLGQVERKIVGLAKAMPAQAFDWRPGEGVRSTSETFMHVAADNYFMPGLLGIAPPAETGITKEYQTTAAFEKRTMSRDQVIAELEKSFAFLKQSLTTFPEAKLDASIDAFGQKMTNRGLWIATVTHLHEHLGQLIAYARSNKVTPPWSK
jgi:uncharacterized damage-inducible protein DinB